jgi:hypothetical protein
LAGVLSALLLAAVLTLIRVKMPEEAVDATQWVNSDRGAILTATKLMPFAGITFLWFIAVVRDGLGRWEDRFFATVFLGSGLLFLAIMFVSTAVAAALVASNTGIADQAAHAEVIAFGKLIVVSAAKTYAIKMAAVFMMSLATIWLKTGVMPRWLVVVSYLTAATLLIGSDLSMWLTLAFPLWMLVVSALLLIRADFFDTL